MDTLYVTGPSKPQQSQQVADPIFHQNFNQPQSGQNQPQTLSQLNFGQQNNKNKGIYFHNRDCCSDSCKKHFIF